MSVGNLKSQSRKNEWNWALHVPQICFIVRNWAGVGKTSLATALAETWLGSRRALVRVDAWPSLADQFLCLFMFIQK